MALAYDANRDGRFPGRFQRPAPGPAGAGARPAVRVSAPNTISASQARAARRREALSNERAVAAWLRELSGRPR